MIDILFEDSEALVIDKPSGLSVERPRKGGPSLEDHVEQLKMGFQRPAVAVHRLDTDTSGCLLLARNPKALKRFNRAFEERLPQKTYLGIVSGVPEQEEGLIELALSKISSAEKGWRMIPAKKGKPALTHWRLIRTVPGGSLVEFKPETGRTHQIRVHAASGLGFPLIGDPVYGPVYGEAKGAKRTMLHASALVIPRGFEEGGKPDIVAHSPMPADFAALAGDAPSENDG